MAGTLPPPQQESIHLNEASALLAPSSRPDAKTQKYDRQLRLWASTGQNALENSSILVINAGASSSSSLKNLVLPGIGKFTILDDAKVEESDLGNNFFLESSSLGKNRAEEVVRLLGELNSDVEGVALVQDLDTFLCTSDALNPYSLILAINVPPTSLLKLSTAAWEKEIPFIKVQTIGFYALLRSVVREIPIVETHPESLVDMRIHHPFPSLLSYAQSFDFDSLNSEEHAHIPAIVILIQALESWKSSHGGSGPKGAVERKEFIKVVEGGKRNQDAENFEEAVELFRRAGIKPPIPSEIESLFEDPACTSVTASSSNFWLLTSALHSFTRHPSNPSRLLPLSGALPDMKASTSRYVDLQNIYKSKAKEDLFLFEELLKKLDGGSRVGREEIETFVKHSGYLKVVRGRSLKEEHTESRLIGHLDEIIQAASYSEIPDHSLWIYIAFRASDLFYEQHGRYPGTAEDDKDGEKDVQSLTTIAGELLESLGGSEVEEDAQNVLAEVCRAGASDLPQIAALVGGLVGQEAIKLITRQYIPLNGTAVWDGITSGVKVLMA